MTTSHRSAKTAIFHHTIPAGEPWMGLIRRGQTFRLVDVEGNQAADTVFYGADRFGRANPHERYSNMDTILHQKALYLSTGSELKSNQGNTLLKITADTCGRHDTVGGACSCEANSIRYPRETQYMHSCRDSFLRALRESGHHSLTKRDLPPNINFFMNVPVTPDGKLSFADGVSGPGKYVEMVAEIDVIALISNCPQLNNPCNDFNPTPIDVLIWD